MKKALKIGAAIVILLASLTACGSVPTYDNSGQGPIEPGQTEMRSQSQSNSIPEPGQTEMRRQD